jgi:hypothetical protein
MKHHETGKGTDRWKEDFFDEAGLLINYDIS